MPDLPTGTVTFLFTDIEGSTRLWEQHPEAMRRAIARHDTLAADTVARHGGTLVKSRGEGDSLFAVFGRATDAVAASCALQRALVAETWPAATPMRVRVALHTGEAELRDGDYFGAAVNRCSRLRAAGHGGQVLLSRTARDLVQDDLPEGVSLRDLGLHRLRDLQRPEHVFQLLHPDLPAEFPSLRSLDALPNNLPQQVTSFVGRERETEEVKQLLGRTRLLTLTGAGGTGKTRLALQVAAELLPEYPDGIWLVELAPLSDPALVPQAVASALGIREEAGKPLAQVLAEALRPKQLLLVLDNCEHLLGPCATLLDALLRGCPSVGFLATSREGLNIPGETPYRLHSLAVPGPHLPLTPEELTRFEAVRLFLERASTLTASFAVTPQNAASVAQVCSRLDGIPLAIELAAARVKALPVEKIAERLDDRFRLLTGGSRAALPRQQTLRALIDWSYDLLSEPERTLLRRLSVFAGGWTLEAAEAVCAEGAGAGGWGLGVSNRQEEPGAPALPAPTPNPQPLTPTDVLDLLMSLVEKSLVQFEEGGGEGRYRLLETVRQYARDRLLESGEAEGVRDRHVEFFLGMVERGAAAEESTERGEGLHCIERDYENLRGALAWGMGTEKAFRLAAALIPFWWQRDSLTEGRARLEEVLRATGSPSPEMRAKVLFEAGNMALRQGDLAAARRLLEECASIRRELGDRVGYAHALSGLGHVASTASDYSRARALFEEVLASARERGEPLPIAFSLQNLGHVASRTGDYAGARALFEESIAVQRELSDQGAPIVPLLDLGHVARWQGDYAAARAYYEEALSEHRQGGRTWGVAHALHNLGHIARFEGDTERAGALYREALLLFRQWEDQVGLGTVLSLEAFAKLAVARGQLQRAGRLFGAAEAARAAMGSTIADGDLGDHKASLAAAKSAPSREEFTAAWDKGRGLTLEQAVANALEAPDTTASAS